MCMDGLCVGELVMGGAWVIYERKRAGEKCA